jgi:hypothetical protein
MVPTLLWMAEHDRWPSGGMRIHSANPSRNDEGDDESGGGEAGHARTCSSYARLLRMRPGSGHAYRQRVRRDRLRLTAAMREGFRETMPVARASLMCSPADNFGAEFSATYQQ